MANKKMKVEEEYEEKDLRTHIYETTDTYAGSDQLIKAPLAIMKEGEKNISLHIGPRLESITIFILWIR